MNRLKKKNTSESFHKTIDISYLFVVVILEKKNKKNHERTW